MGIITWIIVGALAGWLASLVMKTDAEQGAVANIIVGIVGAIIGGFLMNMLTGDDTTTGFNIMTILTATIGAIILLAILKAMHRPSSRI